jgi:hypothetical protein
MQSQKNKFNRPLNDPEAVPVFSEKLLYHIWDAQHIIKNLTTVSGKKVNIMYPGQWNNDFGPDFRNVILSIDGEVVRGDVEIHLKSYDWTAHKHSEDINFNSIILHVVYEHNGHYPCTITEDGSQVEILELKCSLDQDLAKLVKKFPDSKVLNPEFCPFFAGLEIRVCELLLTRLGIARMEKKIKRYAAELYFSDFNQLLYQGIMEAAGYNKNSYNMLQLALTYPYIDLLQWKQDGMTLRDMQSLWLRAGDLYKHVPKGIVEQFPYLTEELPDFLEEKKKPISLKWNLFRVRPVNHPVIRLLQVSDFIYANLENGLLSSTLEMFSQPDNEKAAKEIAKKILLILNNIELPKHFKLGIDRVNVMLINIFLPIIILYGDKMGFQKLRENAWIVYSSFQGLPSNFIEQHIEQKYLNESQRKLIAQKAIYQQGLLKLYFDFCRSHNCELCSIHKKDLIMGM